MPRLNADTYELIVSALNTSDVLSCAQVCTKLRALCHAALQDTGEPKILERASDTLTGKGLLWLARQRLGSRCVRMDVSECEYLTKAQICTVVAQACPALCELTAVRVGPGSWSSKHIGKLLEAAPPSLRRVRIDVLLEMKKDLHEGSPLLAALANPLIHVERLKLITDNVTAARSVETSAASATATADEAAAAAMSMAALDIGDAAADAVADVDDDHDSDDEAGEADVEGRAALSRLASALLASSRLAHADEAARAAAAAAAAPGEEGDEQELSLMLREMDASSGALGVAGAASSLLCPLVSASSCALRTLSVCYLSRSGLHKLAKALVLNSSLRSLSLKSNMIYGSTTAQLASALASHASLTHLDLDHNPILDGGGKAVAAVLPRTRIGTLSMAFTGVGDATCEALAHALGSAASCALRTVTLSGNRITTAGVSTLADSLGPLRSLDLTANLSLDGGAAVAVAKALPGSSLRSLSLAGCKVDKKGCSRLAASLVHAQLTTLDLASNHFGSAGSDELAWVLGDIETLTSLSLADCAIEDDGGDELLEALVGDDDDDGDDDEKQGGGGEATQKGCHKLRRLDLRWNKLGSKHQRGRGISADKRAIADSQKQPSAADRQTAHLEATWQQAKATGKKVYVPKWLREEQKKKQAAGSGSGGGMGSAMA
jgi:Ran GTPase-activating protein (RanGAP) involved in mRNA processing and transport